MTWMFYTSMEGVNTMKNSLPVKMSQHTLRKVSVFGVILVRIFPAFSRIPKNSRERYSVSTQ